MPTWFTHASDVEGTQVLMVGELKLDRAMYRRMVLAASRSTFWFLRAVGGFVVLLAVVSSGYDGPGYAVFLAVVGVFVLGVPSLGIWLGWRRTSPLTSRPWRYEVSEATVGIHTPQTDVTVNWTGIRQVRTERDVWVLRPLNRQAVPIPRTAFTAEDAARIDELASTLPVAAPKTS
jgi:hypothetical protein